MVTLTGPLVEPGARQPGDVRRDPLVALPAEELDQRQPGELAADVPQRHLHSGQNQVGEPWRIVEAAQTAHLGEQPLDVEHWLADKEWSDASQQVERPFRW